MARFAPVVLSLVAFALLGACSSGRRAPARTAPPAPTSIAYVPGSSVNWTTQPAAGFQQPRTVYAPTAPVAPVAPRYVPAAPAPDYSNVAPYPQPPVDPAYQSAPAPALTPTPGPSVSPSDWSTPSAPPAASDWAAPIPPPPGR